MAMTIKTLEKTLKKAFPGLRYDLDMEAERITFASRTESYRDVEGEACLSFSLELFDQGAYLEVKCPFIYDASESQHKGAVSRVLLGVSLRTKLVQFSFDEADGEIRASAELVLADGTCTSQQLKTMLGIVQAVIEDFHPHIVRAMEIGEVSFPNEETIVRPAMTESEGEPDTPVSIDLGDVLKGMLVTSRERGRKEWENAGPKKGPGRHI